MLNSIDDKMPQLRELNGRKALFVNDKPFIPLGLQWNCEYCYSPAVMDPPFEGARKMGLNSASLLVYWNEIEPEEGRYYFDMLDHRIEMCRKYGLKMILVWFASYKNASMFYAPDYIKGDTETYPRAWTAEGDILSNFCCPQAENTHYRDELALTAMFNHIKEVDSEEHTIVLFQIENETGLLGTDRCYCPKCSWRFEQEDWSARYGYRAAESFTAKCIAEYCDSLTAVIKSIYPLPVYMNVWLDEYHRVCIPGRDYPSGGPTGSVLDIYRETVKNIDFLAPDIYQYGYEAWHHFCKLYSWEGNPLFIPECATGRNARTELNAVYALGEFAAIGFDPWAIDCNCPAFEDEPLIHPADGRLADHAYELHNTYKMISEAMIPIAKAQNTSRLKFFVQEPGDRGKLLRFDDICCEITYNSEWGVARGFVIQLAKDEYVLPGCFFSARFTYGDGTGIRTRSIEQGAYEDEVWHRHVWLAREQEDFSRSFPVRQSSVIKVKLEL